LLTVLAATIGTLTLVSYAAAVDTNSTSNSTATTVTADSSQGASQFPPQFGGNMMMYQGPGTHMGEPRGHGMMGGAGIGNIEISSEYAANVNSILNNDTDVAALITQGYNVTAIKPDIKTVVQADGTIVNKATTATVLLQGTSGFATVNVDVANAKVTQIIEVTRTVIDKNSS
jgi:hypothetical protein